MFSSNNSQVSNDVKYIEDVCSVYLRTGTGSSQTVTTGIKENTGALVISKSRSAATDWAWYDTFRGATYDLVSNSTAAQTTQSQGLTSFNTDGHTWGTLAKVNTSGATYVDTVLKPTQKFFDIVTFTGNGTGQNISHNLGSAPACIILKRVNLTGTWPVYHRSLGAGSYAILNTTAASNTSTTYWNNTAPTSTVFTVGSNSATNAVDELYVAYLFAHDAGGFGLTGTDNVISCGSYTGNGADPGPDINLGYEAQWVLIKNASDAASWRCFDVMRGMPVGAGDAILQLNSSAAESTQDCIRPTATGFQLIGADQAGGVAYNVSGNTYIYIAIRRGPMKVPTDATKVFAPVVFTDVDKLTTAGFPVDTAIEFQNISASNLQYFSNRLTAPKALNSRSTAAETTETQVWASNTQVQLSNQGNSYTRLYHMFRRAPSFMDVVCYTGGTGTPRVLNHNLATPPELVITKVRNFSGEDWVVHYNNGSSIIGGYLNNTTAFADSSTAPSTDITSLTSTTYTLNTSNRRVNGAYNYVAYLFATCAGVSKVGSYTGTGTTLQVNCGFTGGARFVLIKRTDSTGDWYVWDSARGIVSGNDPYLLLNSTAAEVTSTDYIDTYSAGFEISSTAPAAINASGGTFIFLAIA